MENNFKLKKKNQLKNLITNQSYNFKFKIWICLPLIFSAILIDTLSKTTAIQYLKLEKEKSFLPHFINFDLINNKGSAYGSNANHFALTITLALLITLIAMVIFTFFYNKFYIISFSFIIAGGIANLTNRIWNHGFVTDFLSWELFSSKPEFIFNLADFFICFGITLMISSIILIDIIFDIILKKKKFTNEN